MKRSDSTASELNDFVENADGKKEYNVSKSRLMRLINWMYVFKTYVPIALLIVVIVLVVQTFYVLYVNRFDFQGFFSNDVLELNKPLAMDLGWKTMAILALALWYITHRDKPVYLLDFSTFEPPDSWKLSQEQLMEAMTRQNCFTPESLDFLDRMLKQSGVGPRTAWPPGITQCLQNDEVTGLPKNRDFSVEAARKESEVVMFGCVRDLLQRTGVNPKSIDILVINCSLFSPTPSLCSMVANEFGMKSDVSTYNLSGMGCSAGVVSIELVKNLLAGRPGSRALVVSTENLTQQLYLGNERGFLLQNTLFRCGGAAVLLSNRWTDAFRAKLKLLHVVRTQYVSDDSYGCVYETEDANGLRGVRLSKDIVKVAGRAMEKNFTQLGPLVLPMSEQLKVVFSIVSREVVKRCNAMLGTKWNKPASFIPDFKRGIDHFCIHAGGRGVIDGIEKNLSLTPRHVEASRHALHAYGNTSSSSIWYEMDYIRNHMDLRRGQRVLQVAFGSGFKCNSAVWLCINGGRSTNGSSSSDKDAAPKNYRNKPSTEKKEK